LGEKDELELRMISIRGGGGDNDDITSLNAHIPLGEIEGPIIRASAIQLNLEVTSFLSMSLYVTLAFGSCILFKSISVSSGVVLHNPKLIISNNH
jgi:hypothetical protein